MENPILNGRKTLVFVLRVSFSPWQRIAVWWNRRSAARAEIISPPPSPFPLPPCPPLPLCSASNNGSPLWRGGKYIKPDVFLAFLY